MIGQYIMLRYNIVHLGLLMKRGLLRRQYVTVTQEHVKELRVRVCKTRVVQDRGT